MAETSGFLERPDGAKLAWRAVAGAGPTVVWLGGFRSDMAGTKAQALADWAQDRGRAYVRFDYFGHGESEGEFAKGTITRWRDDALAVLETLVEGPAVLVGSSMGGWISCLVAGAVPQRVAAMVLIAPAPDFTIDLIEPNLSDAERASLAERGYFEEPSEYGPEPNIFTRALIEDGRANRVLTGVIETGCPVHILQGMADPDVPYAHAVRLMEHLSGDDVVLTMIRDGDHRLSRPQDIAKILEAAETLARGA